MSVSYLTDVTETALIGAAFRARESARFDALLYDPLARRLAGRRGFQLARGSGLSWIIRARLIDRMIFHEVCNGARVVVNVGAGLDTRPYRLRLPPLVHWVEIDLPEVFARKRARLGNAQPRCRLTRIALDLEQGQARRRLLARLAQGSRSIAVTEGVLIYLTMGQTLALARDLADAGFAAWALDLLSPMGLKLQQHGLGRSLASTGAPLCFAPRAGAALFRRHGWEVKVTRSILREAVGLGRLPAHLGNRLIAAGIESQVCLLHRAF